MSGVAMQREHQLKQSFMAILRELFNDEKAFQQSCVLFTDLINNRASDTTESIDSLANKFVERIRDKVADKELLNARIDEIKAFVRAEIAEVRQEMAEMKQEIKAEITEIKGDMNNLRSSMRYVATGIVILMVILQPKVFDALVSALGIIK